MLRSRLAYQGAPRLLSLFLLCANFRLRFPYHYSLIKWIPLCIAAVKRTDENATRQCASEHTATKMDNTIETGRETSEADENWLNVIQIRLQNRLECNINSLTVNHQSISKGDEKGRFRTFPIGIQSATAHWYCKRQWSIEWKDSFLFNSYSITIASNKTHSSVHINFLVVISSGLLI